MNNIRNTKVWKNVVNGKTLHFIVYTWIFTVIFNNLADKELTKVLNANNQSIFTYNYTLGAWGLLLVIPAALISVLITIGFLKIRNRFFPSLTTGKMIAFVYSFVLKLAKILWKTFAFLTKGTFFIIMLIVNAFSSNGSAPSSKGGFSPRAGGSGRSSNKSSDNRKLKSEAEWEARQKQKEANYAWKQAVKQGNDNDKTYHFDNSVNRANAKQREANEAAKRARNL